MKYLVSLIIISSSSIFCTAQEKSTIDLGLDNCLSQAPTKAQVNACFEEAWDAWDKALNTEYQIYKSHLSAQGKALLTRAQRQWILYRNAEFKRIDQHYYQELGGLMWTAAAYDEKIRIIKTRALSFKAGAKDLSNKSN